MFKAFVMISLCFLSGTSVAVPAAEPTAGPGKTVEYLLDYVRGSDLTFIRNSRTHTGPQAAEHMRNKYEHFRDEIVTAEDFIDRAASKSLLTGKPYLVILEDNTRVPTRDWLAGVLADYRNQDLRAAAAVPPDAGNQDIRKPDEP